MNQTDRYTDFVNRNTENYRADMRHIMADIIEDIVDFSDRHHVDREQTMLEVGQSLRMIPGYADMKNYRPTPNFVTDDYDEEYDNKEDLPL